MRTLWGRRLVGTALLSFLVAALLDTAFGCEVTLLHTLYSDVERAEARAFYDPRDDVAELYGRPEPEPRVRVIVFDRDRLITPREAPARRLLFVDRAAGEDVVPARALWFRVGLIAAPLGLLGLFLVAAGRPKRPGS